MLFVSSFELQQLWENRKALLCTHTRLTSLRSSLSTHPCLFKSSGFALLISNGKGQRRKTVGTVFPRTVLGEFSEEFKT